MSHFSEEEWVCLIRGLLPPAQARAMQAVMDDGCNECRASFEFWQTILETLPRNSGYEPSEAAVQSVKDAYVAEKPWKWMVSAAKFARVLFDSLQEPALAGVRSSGKLRRQITVEAEPFIVDLQLESDSAKRHVSLTGQVLISDRLQSAIQGADVVLLSADQLMRKTKANDLGEFYLDFAQAKDLRLFINIRGERAIGIVIPTLDNGEAHETR